MAHWALHVADSWVLQLSFETVVLKGLAADGGLFLPHQIPTATEWVSTDIRFAKLGLEDLKTWDRNHGKTFRTRSWPSRCSACISRDPKSPPMT